MQNLRKYLPAALFLTFLFLGISAFMLAKPSHKVARVYKVVKEYSPYYLQKTIGGLNILKKGDKEFKESPDNAQLYRRLEFLEKEWGKRHLRVVGSKLFIADDSNKTVKTLELKSKQEFDFVKNYYGVGE